MFIEIIEWKGSFLLKHSAVFGPQNSKNLSVSIFLYKYKWFNLYIRAFRLAASKKTDSVARSWKDWCPTTSDAEEGVAWRIVTLY